MADTLFRDVRYNLNKLIEDIEMGEIGLPTIQRPFVWSNAKVRDLLDSMYRGFPVGFLLFWANGLSTGHRQVGTNSKQIVPRLLIVDGQQRLTSLFAVMKGIPVLRDNYRKEKINIAFRPRDHLFAVTDAAIKRDPEFVPDISSIWVDSRNKVVEGFINQLRARRPVDEDEEDRLKEALDGLYDLRMYPFNALELSASVQEEEVADVFVRVNSMGTILNQADFILTLMSVFWDEGRANLESFCRETREPSLGPSSFNHFLQPDPDQLLRVSVGLGFRRARLEHVYSLLRGKDMETGEFSNRRREKQFDTLRHAQAYVLDIQNWQDFLKVIARAGYRSSSMITSQLGALYSYVFFLIGRRDYGIGDHVLRNLTARWFFMTSLTGRYTESPESRMEQDLALLRGVRDAETFEMVLSKVIEDSLTEDYWRITLPNDLATSASRSPSLFAYVAALNLLEAKVLFSDMKVSDLLDSAYKAKRTALERHHLFPKAQLMRTGIVDNRDVNQIANFALLEWPDNAAISDESPATYYPRYAGRVTREMCYWHALPDNWHNMPYADFLTTRRGRMAQVIRDGFKQLLSGRSLVHKRSTRREVDD